MFFDNEFSVDGNECLNSLSHVKGPPQGLPRLRTGIKSRKDFIKHSYLQVPISTNFL